MTIENPSQAIKLKWHEWAIVWTLRMFIGLFVFGILVALAYWIKNKT